MQVTTQRTTIVVLRMRDPAGTRDVRWNNANGITAAAETSTKRLRFG